MVQGITCAVTLTYRYEGKPLFLYNNADLSLAERIKEFAPYC